MINAGSMSELFPSFIPRKPEEERIRNLLVQARNEKRSQIVFVTGVGGIGKTFFLRHLKESIALKGTVWVPPIDVDDPEYWLIANLERKVADDLHLEGPDFGEYFEYISNLRQIEQPKIGHETVLAYLRRGREPFLRCYERFVNETNLMPVIVLDTLEMIRGTDMLLSLTQWIKQLPPTFFVLAGRPQSKDLPDELINEFKEPHQSIPFEQIELSGFSEQEASAYLEKSAIGPHLSGEEKEKLAWLTKGNPLFLALTVYYLTKEDIPREVKRNGIQDLKEWLPYQQVKATSQGEKVYDEFIRRLMLPFREPDFWHEAIRRLTVVRRGVNQSAWENLMRDKPLPPDVRNWNEAWSRFLQLPWIRPRANFNYITLHDALAEQLADRIVPLLDVNGAWRRQQWEKATKIYKELLRELEDRLGKESVAYQEALISETATAKQRELIQQASSLDVREREVEQLKATYFFYQMLCDDRIGCKYFIEQFDQVNLTHRYPFRESLWQDMQRFLPGAVRFDALGYVIGDVVEGFRKRFKAEKNLQYEIYRRGCKSWDDNGRSQEAIAKLDDLLRRSKGDREKEFTLLDQRGFARLRSVGQVLDAEKDLKRALRLTTPKAPRPLKKKHGEALKSLGVFYRHIGKWKEAANYYREALIATPLAQQVEQAAIQSNWAYVQALRGQYAEANSLVEASLKVRRSKGLSRGTGMALSVQGEVYRYARDFPNAWKAYQESESIFEDLGNWPWLGQVRQQQAICLFQAYEKETALGGWSGEELLDRARALAVQALEICDTRNVSAYPSALNRAGRIFGHDDFDTGLRYLKDGIAAAKEVGDWWFWFANIIEYSELSYRAWMKTRDAKYRNNIFAHANEVTKAIKEYDFPDLWGRWELLQGNLALGDGLKVKGSLIQQQGQLRDALRHYERGFGSIVKGPVGSHGAPALPNEFAKFKELFQRLPVKTRKAWCEGMRVAWSSTKAGYIDDLRQATPLQAELTKLYEELVVSADKKRVVEK